MTLTIPDNYFDIYFDMIGATPWFRDAVKMHYNEPHRHYHTMTHIGLMLNHLNLSQDRKAKVYACFMHDIIYDPKASNNEYLSARLAKSWSDMTNLSQNELELSYMMILATDGHNDVAYDDPVRDFIQADLSIFNESFPIYCWYVDAIRKEYAHVPLIDYCQGRSKILDKFLDLSYINGSNIEWELDKLEKYEI